MLGELVLVEWEDIVAHSGWYNSEGFNVVPAVIKTIGVLVEDKPGYITVSSTWGPPDSPTEYNQHITIPKGCLNRISRIVVTIQE